MSLPLYTQGVPKKTKKIQAQNSEPNESGPQLQKTHPK